MGAHGWRLWVVSLRVSSPVIPVTAGDSRGDGLFLQGSSAATTSGPGPGPWFLPAADKPQQELNKFSSELS